MSFNVLVVPENPTYNGSILKPLCERLLADCGKTNAKIEVLANPRTNGYEHAKSLFPETILDLYEHKDLVLFLPDSDGKDKSAEFAALEAEFGAEATQQGKEIRLICCAAVPEVEAWLLAGIPEKWERGWQWGQMRQEGAFKETYFNALLHGNCQEESRLPDQGRKRLMTLALPNFGAIKQRCPELQELQDRITRHIRDND